MTSHNCVFSRCSLIVWFMLPLLITLLCCRGFKVLQQSRESRSVLEQKTHLALVLDETAQVVRF